MRSFFFILLTMLCFNAKAQFLYSHFTDWHSQFNHCWGTSCPTFDILNVNSAGSCPSCRWYRIGTPHKAGSSEIEMWGDHYRSLGEGVFTDFNFVAGKTYKIRIGITYSGHQWGRLALTAVSGLVETPNSVDICCHEPFIDLPATPGWANGYWQSNGPGMTPGSIPPVEPIAYIRPGFFTSGPVEKFVLYTPVNSHSQFAVYADGHDNIQQDQYDVTLDYLYIEEVCNAPISYYLNTQNILDVNFTPPYNPNTTFDWTMGDGTTNNASTSFNHTYPGYGSYTACVKLDNNEGQGWECQGCVNLCLNEPENMDGEGPGEGVVLPPEPCSTSHFFFYGNNSNTEVALSPVGGYEPYYKIDWGDGTIQTYSGPAMSSIHTYSMMSGMSQTYTVCLETGIDCKTCIDVCVAKPYDAEIVIDDRDVDLGQGEGKPGKPASDGKGATQSTIDHETQLLAKVMNMVPNPAASITNLEVKSEVEDEAQLTIIDVTGRVVMQSTHKLKVGINSIQLNVGELTKGIYMVELTTNTSKQVHKLVKQ